jgi:hypothetical protein
MQWFSPHLLAKVDGSRELVDARQQSNYFLIENITYGMMQPAATCCV